MKSFLALMVPGTFALFAFDCAPHKPAANKPHLPTNTHVSHDQELSAENALNTKQKMSTTLAPQTQTGPQVRLYPPSKDPINVSVEIADNDDERMRGLMFRKSLAPDAGMLFLFEHEEHQSFWMHNTLIPLDMIFITKDKRVLGVVQNATPQTDDAREVPGESQFVLEVNGGWSDAHGIVPGTRVEFLGL